MTHLEVLELRRDVKRRTLIINIKTRKQATTFINKTNNKKRGKVRNQRPRFTNQHSTDRERSPTRSRSGSDPVQFLNDNGPG